MRNTLKTTIILPTYNEAGNIENIVEAINSETLDNVSILVVDDYSPDGTADIVRDLMNRFDNLNIIQNENRGLGRAYIKGFKHCIDDNNVLFEMDADFSHSPKDIAKFLAEIQKGADFVIGSRYVRGGSIPKNWGLHRKLNSWGGNVFARYVAGVGQVKDCTSGFRAIKTSLLKKIDLDNLDANGYYFQLKLLHEAVKLNAKIVEIPIAFVDRKYGKSKLGLKDIIEFVVNSIKIRFS